jgi:hypothetical protein
VQCPPLPRKVLTWVPQLSTLLVYTKDDNLLSKNSLFCSWGLDSITTPGLGLFRQSVFAFFTEQGFAVIRKDLPSPNILLISLWGRGGLQDSSHFGIYPKKFDCIGQNTLNQIHPCGTLFKTNGCALTVCIHIQ